MSYISLPRLTFTGAFQADVNTVNNDVRHYDKETFEPRFQKLQVPLADGNAMEYNGWWNPDGGNTFRLMNCTVSGAVGPDGAPVAGDPVLTMGINVQFDRTASKIVDLDPQMQFCSALWGLRVILTSNGAAVASGDLVPTPFRDIFFGRLTGLDGNPVSASPGASARFTGTLQNVTWTGAADASPLLAALKAVAVANGNRLSLSLMTYGYTRTPGMDEKTFGLVLGTIGTWTEGDPLTFAPSRRFAQPAGGLEPPPPFSMNFMDGVVSPGNGWLSLDFGNALPLSEFAGPGGQTLIAPTNYGPLTVAVLTAADTVATDPKTGLTLTAASQAGQPLTADQYVTIGTLDTYDYAWLQATGGIADFAVPAAAAALIADHPLAILGTADTWTTDPVILIRETVGGIWVRADDFVQRVDAAETGWVDSPITLYAMRYGQPYADAPLQFTLAAPDPDEGGTGPTPKPVRPPQAPIPVLNIPDSAVRLPQPQTTGANGTLTVTWQAANPLDKGGKPVRGYIDGQIFNILYAFGAEETAPGQSPMPSLESVWAHVRNAFTPPATPSWETDIAPILVQYGNLYPIMSRGLFSFSDYNAVVANARLLYLAFTRPIEDTNYMPSSRDMSAGQMRMLIDWLSGYLTDAPNPSASLPVPPEGSTLEHPHTQPPTLARDSHPTRPALGRKIQAMAFKSLA